MPRPNTSKRGGTRENGAQSQSHTSARSGSAFHPTLRSSSRSTSRRLPVVAGDELFLSFLPCGLLLYFFPFISSCTCSIAAAHGCYHDSKREKKGCGHGTKGSISSVTVAWSRLSWSHEEESWAVSSSSLFIWTCVFRMQSCPTSNNWQPSQHLQYSWLISFPLLVKDISNAPLVLWSLGLPRRTKTQEE